MKKFLFSVCSVLALSGCGGDDGELPRLGWDNDAYVYCRYNARCEFVSVEDCTYYYGGTNYGSDSYCSGGGGDNNPGGGGKGNDISNYRTVNIGSQKWMAENLNYNVSGSKCYGNSESNCNTYGRLYNWSTAMGLPSNCNSNTCSNQIQSKHRGICPIGWHIPNDADWNVLMDYVGGSSVAGTKLKSTSGWYNNGNGTDDYGFSALPGGYGYSDGSFLIVGDYGYWWSASEYNSFGAYLRGMRYNYDNADWGNIDKSNLFSVRCLQD